MRILKRLCMLTALAICLPASADFETVERAYEVPLSMYRAPATSTGSVAFKECGSCDMRVVRVTPKTAYVFNREHLELAEFRKALAALGDREHKFVIILHHLESDTTSSITLNL